MKKLFYSVLTTPIAVKHLIPSPKKQNNRMKKGEMFYRRLGRTNLYISEIALGGSPLPDMAVLYQAIERGVNYIDTSHSYSNGNSERKIGNLLKTLGRDKTYVGTKFHLRGKFTEDSIITSVNNSLRRLQSDYIDVLLIHGAKNEENLTDERVIQAFEKLKKQGKYRFRGLSCHSNHQKVVTKAVECGYYDMVLLGYNVFDIKDTEEEEIEVYDDYLETSGIQKLLIMAKAKDVGIIAMKTLKIGRRRQNLEKYKSGTTSSYQAALKWALESQEIASVAIEMLTFDQLEEDLKSVMI